MYITLCLNVFFDISEIRVKFKENTFICFFIRLITCLRLKARLSQRNSRNNNQNRVDFLQVI